MNHKVVVAGTGRCGTLYAARLLTAAGLATSHEVHFRPELGRSVASVRQVSKRRVSSYLPSDGRLVPRLRALRPFVGEASRMCVPELHRNTSRGWAELDAGRYESVAALAEQLGFSL